MDHFPQLWNDPRICQKILAMVQFSLNKGGGFDRDALTRMRSIYPPENSSLGKGFTPPISVEKWGWSVCFWVIGLLLALPHGRNLEKLARQRFKTFQPQKPLRLAGEIPAVARSLKIPWYPQCIASKRPWFLAWRKQSDPICNHFEQVYEFSTSTRRRLEPKWSQRSRRPWASVVLLLGGTFVRRIHRGSLDFHRGST